MSVLAQLSHHLPYVRRYARALTGDQVTGDNYVRVALEALAAGGLAGDTDMPPRVVLYHMVHSIWLSSGAQLEPREGASGAGAEQPGEQLMRMAPRSREAFLLTALEGFTLEEVALILGADMGDIEALIAEAQSEIDEVGATDVLIIEDEPIIAADLEATLNELGHRVSDIAATRAEAIDAAARRPPGLILSDIQLADGSSGADAVREILKRHDVPVVVITAFPERLLTGERPEPSFIVTKPFQPGNLKAAVAQALFFHPRPARRAA